jgi:ketosteroid isomerase-like protein
MHSMEEAHVLNLSAGVLLLLCSFVPVPCALAQPTAAVESVLAEQAAAWNQGDIERYMAYYWRSDSLLFTSGGNMQRGWNTTLQKYKRSYDTKEKMGRLEFADLEITMLSDDAAWVFGRWKLVRAADEPGGVFTLVLRKFPEGWRIIHDHTSSAGQVKSQE